MDEKGPSATEEAEIYEEALIVPRGTVRSVGWLFWRRRLVRYDVRMNLESAVVVAILSSGVFFLSGLLTGVWKWRETLSSPDHKAHIYVDVAHRASLMYAFSSLLLAVFAYFSCWHPTIDLVATAIPIFYFAAAIGTYLWHAVRRDTDNQFAERNFITTWGTWLLVAGEVGGFLVLFAGTIRALLF
jgi:hypothetical protein